MSKLDPLGITPNKSLNFAPLLVLAGLLFGADLQAAIITVGTPVGAGQCNCATIQCAFDFAEVGGPHTVRITRSLTYTAQNATLTLDAGEVVTIEGGYATCGQAVADATNTIVSGSGGNADTVLEFELAGTASVQLRRLQVRDGDDTSGSGGGISQVGGTLRIDDSLINFNDADVGGGIYSESGHLVIGSNVIVANNDAGDGGGIALNNSDMTMNEAGSRIQVNHADTGYGGGLWVGPGSNAEIGAPSLAGVGAIFANTAAHGGGAAVIPGDGQFEFAALEMVSVDPAQPTGIASNFASQRGGGLYLGAYCCTSGDQGTWGSATFGEGAYIRENAAPEGAAAYINRDSDDDLAGRLWMTDGLVSLNETILPDATPTNGAVFYLADDPGQSAQGIRGLQLTRTRLQNNEGGHLIRSDGLLRIVGSLIVQNIARLSLVRGVGSDGETSVTSSTIAGNTINAAAVFETSNDFNLHRSILHQPGKTSLLKTGGVRTVVNVVASEIASLTDIPDGGIVQADPQFWDPGLSDYHLHAASIAIDSSALTGGEDLDGNARSVDLDMVGDRGGPTDLGAFERQSLTPLVRNHTFVDLRLWQPNTVTFVQDSAVADGSGGVYVSATAPAGGRVIGPIQCVPLPSHGNYGLRGHGKEISSGMTNADYPRLEWQLYLGNTQCTGGASAIGNIALPSGDAWAQSAFTYFEVPDDGFLRPLASVLIQLVAVDNNASGTNLVDAYFDHILLEQTGDGNLAPTIVSPILNRTNSEGDGISIETSPHFTDPNGDDLTFTATNLPDGVSIDPGGGAIVGTLSETSAGVYSVLVRATDPFGASIAQAFAWAVNDGEIVEEVFSDGFESQ